MLGKGTRADKTELISNASFFLSLRTTHAGCEYEGWSEWTWKMVASMRRTNLTHNRVKGKAD